MKGSGNMKAEPFGRKLSVMKGSFSMKGKSLSFTHNFGSHPQIPVQRAVLDGLAQVRGVEGGRSGSGRAWRCACITAPGFRVRHRVCFHLIAARFHKAQILRRKPGVPPAQKPSPRRFASAAFFIWKFLLADARNSVQRMPLPFFPPLPTRSYAPITTVRCFMMPSPMRLPWLQA